MASNHISKVALVGASGNCGSFIANALVDTGKHIVTALTRDTSQKFPEGVTTKVIDYDRPETLVEALKGQDALVITLSGQTPSEIETKLIHAAGEAGVKWIMPNEWSPDTTNEELVKDVFVFASKGVTRKNITELGKSSFIGLSTGFWYEWSLAIPAAFGIDVNNRTATLFDDGETKVSMSTWPQVGRAVAAILSLPIRPEGADPSACLENLQNKVVYIDSFTINQKDMLDSAFRVTGTTKADWTITKQSSSERYASGLKEMQAGQRVGFVKMLYSRVFYPDGSGDILHKGTLNDLLGLPKEDIDEATKAAIERAKVFTWA